MKLWVLADPHFGHTKLVVDGFRPKGYSDKILINLSRMLKPEDILICLGDVCFENSKMWHKRLSEIKCKKWLLRGNHDSQTLTWYITHGWDFVADRFSMHMFSKKILFSHKPKEDLLGNSFDINIHGHFHKFGLDRVKEMEPELYKILTPKHCLVSLEDSHYQPVTLEHLCTNSRKE